MQDFCHLHCHTQFSLLDGASDIDSLMTKAANDGQQAIALTDHGNMFGAFKFVKAANKKGIKPIIGCEFYMVENRWQKTFEKVRDKKMSDFISFYWLKMKWDIAICQNYVRLVSKKVCMANSPG